MAHRSCSLWWPSRNGHSHELLEQQLAGVRDEDLRDVRLPVAAVLVPALEELVAHGRSVDEIATQIGADKLIYQDLEDLVSSVKEHNGSIEQFDSSCFTGEYITGGVDENFLDNLHNSR